MLTLGIETTGRCGGIALWNDGALLAELAVASSETHSRRLIPSIKWLMERAGVEMKELGCIAVSLGPGSFTGIRIGLSTARGLSISLDADLAGIPTIDVIAARHAPLPGVVLCPMIDARNSRFYTASYIASNDMDGWKRVSDYRISTAPKLAKEISALFHGVKSSSPDNREGSTKSPVKQVMFTGDALANCMDDIKTAFADTPHLFAPSWTWLPAPSVVAALAGRFHLPRNEQGNIRPLYVKLSQAEENRQKKV